MRLLHKPLLIGVLHVVSHPRRVLTIALMIMVGCLLLAWSKLEISTDQNGLIDPSVPFFRDYLKFISLFPENEAIYVLIRAHDPAQPPSVHEWTKLADAIAERLRGMPYYVQSVVYRVPLDQLGNQGLLFDEPARVHQSFAEAQKFVPLVKLWAERPGNLTSLLGQSPIERFVTALLTQNPDRETADFVALVARSWNQTLANADAPLQIGSTLPDLASLDATDPSRLGYYYIPDEKDKTQSVLLVRIYHRTEYGSFTAISKTVEAIRQAVKSVAANYPQFAVGVTGRPALEADEMRTTDTDSRRAEVIALIAVFLGLVVMLRSIWLAIAGEIALCVGIGWTFGWATVSVGELNLLSIVFLLALIGIGMDYLVQILARYRREAMRRRDPKNIWTAVFRQVAAPINTACLGAAGAFLVSIFTRFRGASQLGIIAGGGLLLCLISGYVVLPALLTLFPDRAARQPEPKITPVRPARGSRRTLLLPLIWLVALVAGIPLAMRTQFDPALINMQAPNIESVQLVNHLQTWSAVVLSKELTALRAARDAIQSQPTVAGTESILTAYDNLEWLKQHQHELLAIGWTEPPTLLAEDLPVLARKLHLLAARMRGDAGEALETVSRQIDSAVSSDARSVAARLSSWQDAFIQQLRTVLHQFKPASLNIDVLPPELRSHLIAPDGTFALYAYPKTDLWNHANLVRFATDIERAMKRVPGTVTVTGIALNVFHSTAAIEKAFYKATIYALILIFLLVSIDLRNVRQTLIAISVLALGLPMLVALMGLLNIDWNFANFFGLPILIGAGHEYGVFMVHRYLEARRDPRQVWQRWDVSDRALLLCAYITTVSFGFFWALAHHRGLKSLGLVMAMGTACIYLATIMVVRPLLVLQLARSLKRQPRSEQPLVVL